jgi:hypothetical protein
VAEKSFPARKLDIIVAAALNAHNFRRDENIKGVGTPEQIDDSS